MLIAGDSMLHGIVENKLNGKLHVKVRPFPGALVEDMEDYLKPLLKKKPSHLILHVGTNDTTNSSSDNVVARILNLKEWIKTQLPDCRVVISLPIRRVDNSKADKVIADVNEKMKKKLGTDILNNNNITRDLLGRKGLHLDARGIARFAMNLLGKLNSL